MQCNYYYYFIVIIIIARIILLQTLVYIFLCNNINVSFISVLVSVCAINKPMECQQLERGSYKCINLIHKTDCAIAIDDGRADFGTLSAEEALIAATNTRNIVVVGEARKSKRKCLIKYRR